MAGEPERRLWAVVGVLRTRGVPRSLPRSGPLRAPPTQCAWQPCCSTSWRTRFVPVPPHPPIARHLDQTKSQPSFFRTAALRVHG
jgi:hypothetical protein